MADMRMLDEVRFWAQVIGDGKRTVYVDPDLESRVKGWIAARGLDGLIDVVVSTMLPPGRVYVVDHSAIEGALRASLQQGGRL